jgi:hypothetical protein
MGPSSSELGARFAEALASKDQEELRRVLSPDVVFKGLTPGRFWEARGVDEALEVILDHWFADTDEIEALLSSDTGSVEDRNRLSYLVRVRNGDGVFAVEQQAYFDVSDDAICWMNVLCSGYRAISEEVTQD